MIELSPKYEPLFSAPETVRYFILTGGRGSSKSFSAGTFLSLLTMEQGHRILFTRYTMVSAGLSIIPEFVEKLELLDIAPAYKITRDEIINTATNSSVVFKGIKTSSGDQTAALKSLQGVTTWVLDEAEELTSEDTFDTIDLSIRQKGYHNRVVLIMNPTTKEHWVYKKFFEGRGVQEGFNGVKGDTCYIHTTYQDNLENLDKSFIATVERLKQSNPKKYHHKIEGGWLDKAEGVIFSNWTHGEFDNSLPYLYGQDFGFSIDPTTLIKIAIDDKAMKVYIDECFYKEGLTTLEIYNHNSRFCNSKDLIVADSAEPRLIQELKSKQLNVRPTAKGPDSVRAGILKMQDYQLVLTPNSVNVAKELNNYVWHDKKSDTPIDDYNHAIDAIRYAFMYMKDKPNRGKYAVR